MLAEFPSRARCLLDAQGREENISARARERVRFSSIAKVAKTCVAQCDEMPKRVCHTPRDEPLVLVYFVNDESPVCARARSFSRS